MTNEEMLEKLRKDRDAAKQRMDVAREGIVMNEYAYLTEPCVQRQMKTCVNKFDKVIDPIDKTEQPGVVLYCEKFKTEEPCPVQQCPFHKDNLEYFKAHKEFVKANDKYNNFSWNVLASELKKEDKKGNKIDVLKKLFKELMKAKKEKQDAESVITSVDSVHYGNTKECACMRNVVVTGDGNSTTTPTVCEFFVPGKECDRKDCPMANQNAKYISATKLLKKARTKLINALFGNLENVQ